MTKALLWSRTGAMIAVGLALVTAPADAAGPAQAEGFERDRQAILAMAGNYKVTFDFRETASFLSDYKPIAPKVSGGEEVVRVIEDKGTVIRLQHILVGETDDKKPIVIKHWRQDWVYEPAELLAYRGAGNWTLEPIASGDRAHAWSQTVYQTDDSPRYAGVGRWIYDNGAARWTSNETFRPLARRDATRHPPYDRYLGVNRHALTPTGWIHEQDNAKLGMKNGELVTFVHEVVLNTYNHFSNFQVAAADRYWAKTKTYWAAVRAAWDDAIDANGKLHVTEEADAGSVTGSRLMGLAGEIMEDKTTTVAAIAKAREIIAGRDTALPQAADAGH